jgi:ribosomal protein S25
VRAAAALAHLHLAKALAQGGEAAAAKDSAQAADRILSALPADRKTTTRYRKDWARARWIAGHALTAAAQWNAAEESLKDAAKLYADLKQRNELTAEDREAPAAIDALLDQCRRNRT